ncbi:hypothetical protein AAVH_36882, partial [Aphelenchoides avenae]
MIFAALLAANRLWGEYEVIKFGDRFVFFNFGSKGLVASVVIITAATCILSSAVSGVIELQTLLSFNRMDSMLRRERKNDYRLLVFAITQFVAQMLMSSYYIVNGVCYVFALTQLSSVVSMAFPYIMDILSLSGSVCLLLT